MVNAVEDNGEDEFGCGAGDESGALARKFRELGYPEVTLAERGMKVSF